MYDMKYGQYLVHVWDRWGKKTLIWSHTEYTYCLEYSLDGEYLAIGSADGNGSIRIWRTESYHATSSQTHMERPSRTPKQADTIILGNRSVFMMLSFSRTDSNLLASGGLRGGIQVWNIKERACIHSFESHGGPIHSLFFAGGTDIACIAVVHTGSIIRLWRAEGSSDLSSEIMGEADLGGTGPYRSVAFSPTGSFLATCFDSRTGNESTVAWYDLQTITKTQAVVMPDFTASHIAVTSDSKQLVVGDRKGRIRLLQTCDLSIQRDLNPAIPPVWSVAFDPTCRFLAVGCADGGLHLRTL
jgi:WD40 repeat protein